MNIPLSLAWSHVWAECEMLDIFASKWWIRAWPKENILHRMQSIWTTFYLCGAPHLVSYLSLWCRYGFVSFLSLWFGFGSGSMLSNKSSKPWKSSQIGTYSIHLGLSSTNCCGSGSGFWTTLSLFLFSGHEPIYFTENKEKTLRVSYDRDTHTIEYMN